MLNVDYLGRVFDFVAVPGCGLKCSVSHVETLLNGNTNDDDSTADVSVTYHVSDEAVDPPAAVEGQFPKSLLSFIKWCILQSLSISCSYVYAVIMSNVLLCFGV